MTQMRRSIAHRLRQPLCETVVDCPAARGTEVLVRIERCGVCHSDLHLQDGYFSLGSDKRLDVTRRAAPCPSRSDMRSPALSKAPGRGRRPGDRRRAAFAVYPWIGCGTCAACRARRGKSLLARIAISASTSTAASPPMFWFRIRAICSITRRCRPPLRER